MSKRKVDEFISFSALMQLNQNVNSNSGAKFKAWFKKNEIAFEKRVKVVDNQSIQIATQNKFPYSDN